LKAKVQVILFSKARKYLISEGYRPHFKVIGNEVYLGVSFREVPLNIEFNLKFECMVEFIYYKTVSEYSLLTPETKFKIMEGANIVGEGKILDLIK